MKKSPFLMPPVKSKKSKVLPPIVYLKSPTEANKNSKAGFVILRRSADFVVAKYK